MVKSKYGPRNTNGCRFCPRVLCCRDCRDRHEKNRHPEPKCLMCVKQSQPFQFRDKQDASVLKKDKLLWHIAFSHLPVYCKICGETYRTNQQFLSAKPCRGFAILESLTVGEESQEVSELDTPPTRGKENLEDASCEPLANGVVISKAFFSTPLVIVNKSCIIASNKTQYQPQAHQLEFDSPPAENSDPNLARQTSTPVHGTNDLATLTLKKQAHLALLALKDCRSPFQTVACSLSEEAVVRVPDSPSVVENGKAESPGQADPNSSREKQLEAKLAAAGIWSTPTTILKKTAERSILKPQALERLQADDTNSSASSEKRRVRFSDQHLLPPASPSVKPKNKESQQVLVITAAESIGSDPCLDSRVDVSMKAFDKETPAAVVSGAEDDVFNAEPPVEVPGEACTVVEKDSEKKKDEGYDTAGEEDKKKEPNESDYEQQSRVVMMLLVEQVDAPTDLSRLDLRPLIDTGLKQLDQIRPKEDQREAEGKKSGSQREPAEPEPEAEQPDDERIHRRLSSSDPMLNSAKRKPRRGVKLNKTIAVEKPSENAENSPAGEEEGGGGGIFSTMAWVVRSALKMLPGSLSSRNLSPLSANPTSSSPRRAARTRTTSICTTTTEVITAVGLDPHQETFRNASIKRPRSDSADFELKLKGVPSSRAGSPVYKRHRTNWYRHIKGREPIARMRSPAENSGENFTFDLSASDARPQHQSTQNQD